MNQAQQNKANIIRSCDVHVVPDEYRVSEPTIKPVGEKERLVGVFHLTCPVSAHMPTIRHFDKIVDNIIAFVTSHLAPEQNLNASAFYLERKENSNGTQLLCELSAYL